MDKVLVFGISTGSGNVECWSFEDKSPILDKFCRQLAKSTCMSVFVVKGELLGEYMPTEKVNVKFKPNKKD